jgi:F420-dependent oxidoreductase-like protein
VRIGVFVDEQGRTPADVIGDVRAAARAGLAAAWLQERSTWDPLTLLAVAGREVPGIELGTAIVRTQPRHPLVLAPQALTVQAAVGDRLILGIGPSYQPIIEGQYGLSFASPGRHMRDYLTALGPLLRDQTVSYLGETLRVEGGFDAPGAQPPPLLLAAASPVLLRTAGELADGAIVIFAGPAAINDYVVPVISGAAERAGRPAPRIVATVPVSLTADPDRDRAEFAERYPGAADVPAYRAMMDRDRRAGVADSVLAGDEATIRKGVARLADAGATELLVMPVGPAPDRARTVEFLGTL